jgi:hypothetical protein
MSRQLHMQLRRRRTTVKEDDRSVTRMTIATHDSPDAANRQGNVQVAPETTVKQHFVLRAIRQKFAIIVINLATFRPHVFLHLNNIDMVASQLPIVRSLRHRNS